MARSLFDVDDLPELPAVRDMTVGHVTLQDVDEFCKRYHYTGVGGNRTWRYGLWHGPTVLGVVAYNLPTRETCESVFGPEHHQHVWHMGRLALADSAPRNSESRLIAGSLALIEDGHPEVWAVITYAATDAGHIGYVYQATNALYTGTGGHTRYYLDGSGERHSDYLGGWVSPDSARERGWTSHTGGLKHRYIYILGNRRQRRQRCSILKYPALPYPKATA